MLESTRDTIAINHGTNGTDEKTTVDTNPKKVLEHENLISDSEYITLDHQTGENKTHIKTESLKQELQQLHETKQDVLTAGDGITIEGQTISASGGGATHTIQEFHGDDFESVMHVVTIGQQTLTTFVFDCFPEVAEQVVTGELKEQLKTFVVEGFPVSNGAITITNDGTNIKLINSAPSENISQQGTFTYYDFTGGGGEGGGGDIEV